MSKKVNWELAEYAMGTLIALCNQYERNIYNPQYGTEVLLAYVETMGLVLSGEIQTEREFERYLYEYKRIAIFT